jgi:hypothetical protein
MAIQWPNNKYSWGSSITRTPDLEVLKMGGRGYSIRIQKGPALAELSIVFENMNQPEFASLMSFIKANYNGTAIETKLLQEDLTGATTGLFYIQSYSISSSLSPSVTVALSEVIGA